MAGNIIDPHGFTAIYSAAFPPNEIRPIADTMSMLRDDTNYRLFTLPSKRGRTDGFMLYYELPGFVLLDYMAVAPDRRGRGLGGRMLELLVLSFDSPILMEIELPNTGKARDRLRFYEAHGAETLLEHYVLPSYDGSENEVMLLLGIGTLRVPIRDALAQIYASVYKHDSQDLVEQSMS